MSRIRDLWVRKDRTKTPRHGKGLRWQAIWTDGRGGEKKKSHRTKDAAEQWVQYLDEKNRKGFSPNAGRVMVSELEDEWLASQVQWSERHRHETVKTWESHIIPRFGDTILEELTRADLREWVFDMSQTMSPATVDTYFGRLVAFLNWCVGERLIPSSPAMGVALPRITRRSTQYLSVEEYRTLRNTIDPHYREAVDVSVTTGIRPGELWELRAGDVEVQRRRINIARSSSEVAGRLVIGTPKTAETRSVPITQAIANMLASRIHGKRKTDLVFTTLKGQQVRQTNFNARYWKPAVVAAGLPTGLRFYDLRHTAASLAIRSGASVLAVQRMLGHSSASMTLDVYSHLFDDELDSVSDRIGEMFSGPQTATVPLRVA